MLRPATPLAVIIFAAFVLQLITVLSAPIVKVFQLANNGGTTFGVFGFCTPTGCSDIGVGYDTNQNDFTFGSRVRLELSKILILQPIAAFFTFVLFILMIATHFHGPSRSTRFLLALIIFFLPTFLLSLLSFLIDVIFFLPHLGWGIWLMLAATVILFISGILICAMRRTLVSRKSRKDRVARNPEMSGEAFYMRQAGSFNLPRAASPPPLAQDATVPVVNGAPGSARLPGFGTYDSKPRMSGEDDRTPLNMGGGSATGLEGDGTERYNGRRGGLMPKGRGGRGGYGGPQRDQYGNALPPSYSYGPPGSAGRGSANSLPSYAASSGRGGGGYPPRGGYGRGGSGPNAGRGGPGMAMRAAAAGGAMAGTPMMGRGQQRRPSNPDEYSRNGSSPYGGAPSPYGGPSSQNGSYASTSMPQGRRSTDSRYGRNQPPGAPSGRGGYAYGGGYNNQHPGSVEDYPRAESPPPLPGQEQIVDPGMIGQAIEMTPEAGSPVNPGSPFGRHAHPLSDTESELDGHFGRRPSGHSQTSAYTPHRTDSYARPWVNSDVPSHQNTPPLPQEIAHSRSAQRSPPRIYTTNTPPPQRARVGSGDNYFEDVDLQFAPREQSAIVLPQTAGIGPPPSTGLPMPMPTSLLPGPQASLPVPHPHPLEQQHSWDSAQEGPESEVSNFTSISQRGVNPDWDGRPPGGPPGMGGGGGGGEYGRGYAGGEYGYGGVPRRGPPPVGSAQSPQRDFGLSNNPDFEIPGAGPARRNGQRGSGGRF